MHLFSPLEHTTPGAAPAKSRAAVIVDYEQWRCDASRRTRQPGLGLAIPNTLELSLLADELPGLDLIVLQFPKWTDGRAYSQARLLRSRHHFGGELRAAGDVRADMAPLLQRTGFTSAVLAQGESAEVARRALGFFSAHYQADAVEPHPHFRRRAA